MFEGSWNPVSHPEYILVTRKRTKIIWLGNTFSYFQFGNIICYFERFSLNELVTLFNVTKTQCKKISINSCEEWIKFSESCYSTSCKNGKNWTDIDAKKETLKEWITRADVSTKPEFQFDETKFKDNIIITIYDNRKQKRLIIDGIHRAVALTIACMNQHSIPQVVIFECSGNQVMTIFPFDIIQL
jgi:hypothetical protein